MASLCRAAVFSASPTPVCYQQHCSRLLTFCPPQRTSLPKLSEAATASSRSSRSSWKAQATSASGTIELPTTSEAPDAAPEAPGRSSHLNPLISELTEGAHLPSAVEPWLDKLSISDWLALVRVVGDKDWATALQLVYHFNNVSPTLTVSVLWPPKREDGTETGIEEPNITREENALSDDSASEIESIVGKAVSVNPKDTSDVDLLCKALVKVLWRNKKDEEMDQLLQQLKTEGVKPGPLFYNALLNFHFGENHTEKCADLVSEMEQVGIDISPAIYEKLAFASMKKEPLDITVPTKVIKDLMEKGLPVSRSLFTNLLKAYWRNKDSEGVEEVFQAMQSAGYTPDQKAILKVMYCQKINGNYERIIELMEMMDNWGIVPVVNVYDELISAYCRVGLMMKAKECLSLYDSKLGKKPTLVAFNNLIHGYGIQGRFEDALKAFEDIQSHNYRPNAVSYSSIIAALAGVGKLNEALRLYRRMARQGIKPKLQIYNTLIRGLAILDWTREGRKIVNAMRKSPHPLTPEAFGTIFLLFVEGHWYHRAASVLMEMEKEGILLNAEANSGLIRSFGILGEKSTPLSMIVEKSNFEICKLLTALFLTQAEDISVMETVFENRLISYLGTLETAPDKSLLYNAFMDCLWKRGQKAIARKLLGSAREVYAQSTLPKVVGSEWVLDVRGLSLGGAKCALSQWLTTLVYLGPNSKGNKTILVAHDHDHDHDHFELGKSTTDTETLEESKKLEVSQMVLIVGKKDQCSVLWDDRMMTKAVRDMLTDFKSPFVQSSTDLEKLEASVEDVTKWMMDDKIKELVDITHFDSSLKS